MKPRRWHSETSFSMVILPGAWFAILFLLDIINARPVGMSQDLHEEYAQNDSADK